ncbi:hypothetical protein ACVWY3_000108 [Bradyrhizobium sp. USDA 4486]
MHGADRPCHGVEACREHDDVDIDIALGRGDAGCRDRLDRLLAQIDQRDVRPVVGRVIVGIEARTFGAEGMIVWRQRGGRLGILDGGVDLLADQVLNDLVAVDVNGLIGPELRQDVDEVAGRPGAFEALAALGIAQLPAHHRLLRVGNAGHRLARLLAIGRAIALQQAHAILWRRAVMRRQREVRRALEHGEMRGLLGDQRDRLDRRRSGADHGDALAGEIDPVMRPAPGEIDLALEILDAVDLRRFRRGEAAGGHDVMAAGDGRAVVGRELPALGCLVPSGFGDLGPEADVAPEIVAVGDEAEIAQDLGLGRVFLGPGPGALELGIESVAVVDGLDIAARSGVAVPVPGAANVAGLFETDRREAGLAQAVQ